MGESNTAPPNALPSNPEHVSSNADSLSRLSSVLKGLNRGATAIYFHISGAPAAVKAGTYQVDPLRLSQRIIRDCLWNH